MLTKVMRLKARAARRMNWAVSTYDLARMPGPKQRAAVEHREISAFLAGYEAAERDRQRVRRTVRVQQTPRVHFMPTHKGLDPVVRLACGRLLKLGAYSFVSEGVPDHRAITCTACLTAIRAGRA